ncbi:hypothetical protein [Nocardia sp. NPDC048505]|uniref:hypothetical protein n=1 Tax=unclassified Nocardia TaxID=2637762 RepID=UPI0033E8D823
MALTFACPWDPRHATFAGPLIWCMWPLVPASIAIVLGRGGKARAAPFIAGAAVVLTIFQGASMLMFALAMRDFSNFG